MRRKFWMILTIYLVLLAAGAAFITVRHREDTGQPEAAAQSGGGKEQPDGREQIGGKGQPGGREQPDGKEQPGGQGAGFGESGRPGDTAEDGQAQTPAGDDRDQIPGEDGREQDRDEDGTGEADAPGVSDEMDALGVSGDAGASGVSGEAGRGQAQGKQNQAPAAVSEEPKLYEPPTIVWASDMHFMSPSMTDYGKKFQDTVAADDGKIISYTPQLMEAFFDEVIELHPTALILGGDVTFNGEKQCHIDLAERLRRVEEAGVKVLMIPGNHDLNNPFAASYAGDVKTPAESVDAEEFYEIYHEFGYDQAMSRDPWSLSYMYALDDQNWLLLLDSCIYEDGNEMGGRIREETYIWMTDFMTEAAESGITIIPASHHNLLDESRLYTEGCTLENNERLVKLLESWRCPVYLSGHLHLQRIQKHGPADQYGIWEIVGSSFALPPCQYGILKWNGDGSYSYRTKLLDVGAWAEKNGITDENLLNFDEYCRQFLMESVGAKVARKDLYYLPPGQEEAMEELYVNAYESYCGGTPISKRSLPGYENYWMWERNRPDSNSRMKLDIMVGDARTDCRELEIPPY